ncbi:MAG: 50S ribosomal protein L24 [Planctomycetota bacterium]
MLRKSKTPIKIRLRRGDFVQIITGSESGVRDPKGADSSDVGRRGKIKSINRLAGTVVVEGLNKRKKAVRPDPNRNRPGGIIDIEAPLHVSNVMLVCPKCDKPVRFGVKITKNNKKVRVCKGCGSNLGEEY